MKHQVIGWLGMCCLQPPSLSRRRRQPTMCRSALRSSPRLSHLVKMLALENEGQPVRMAFMDVAPTGNSNGRSALLMHGKNFASDYWENAIQALAAAGYRVVVPDQIGFGRSSKPEMRYSLDLLAGNTLKLARQPRHRQGRLGRRFHGWSAGHPLRQPVSGARFESGAGEPDWPRALSPGDSPQSTEALTKIEMAQTVESYRKFVQSYFPQWRPEFEKYVEPMPHIRLSAEYSRYAKVSALTYQMVYDQPVKYDLPLIKVPTLLLIGQLDRTVFGRRFAPPESIKSMGNFPALGKEAARAIPGAKLIELDGVGHVAHVEAPDRFSAPVLECLK